MGKIQIAFVFTLQHQYKLKRMNKIPCIIKTSFQWEVNKNAQLKFKVLLSVYGTLTRKSKNLLKQNQKDWVKIKPQSFWVLAVHPYFVANHALFSVQRVSYFKINNRRKQEYRPLSWKDNIWLPLITEMSLIGWSEPRDIISWACGTLNEATWRCREPTCLC